MTKAEEAALKANCLKCWDNKRHCGLKQCPSMCVKCGSFIEGYERAGKDLALTWDDCRAITKIADSMLEEKECELDENGNVVSERYPSWAASEQSYYEEVLSRYNELKQGKAE